MTEPTDEYLEKLWEQFSEKSDWEHTIPWTSFNRGYRWAHAELSERVAELEAALDQREIDSGLTSDGNLWRFWAGKAKDAVARRLEAEAEMEQLKSALEWYAEQAEAVARHLRSDPPEANALLAIMTTLSLDGGQRAEKAKEKTDGQ